MPYIIDLEVILWKILSLSTRKIVMFRQLRLGQLGTKAKKAGAGVMTRQ